MYIILLEKDMDNSVIYYGRFFEKEEDARNFCEKMNDYIRYLDLSSALYRYTYDKVDPLDGIDITPSLNINVWINKNTNNAKITAYMRLGGEEELLEETPLTQDDVMVHQIPGLYSFEFCMKIDINKKLDDYSEEIKNKAKELSSKLLDYEPETITIEYSI